MTLAALTLYLWEISVESMRAILDAILLHEVEDVEPYWPGARQHNSNPTQCIVGKAVLKEESISVLRGGRTEVLI